MMNQIDAAKAQKIAQKVGLVPARVRGTDVVQLTRKTGGRFDTITWNDFYTSLEKRGLHVYESHGWLKIMK